MTTTSLRPPPATRRDVWLTIAVAVARDGLPEPPSVDLYEDVRIASLAFPDVADVTAWAAYLDATREEAAPRLTVLFADRAGWSWQLHHQPRRNTEQLVRDVLAATDGPPAAVPA